MMLNTDCKIFTNNLTMKISKVTQDIIYHDQARFMAGKKIEDQIKLAQITIEWGCNILYYS